MLLDASALLAFLLKEAGGLEVLNVVSSRPCLISSVTLTEVHGILVGRGDFTPRQVEAQLGPLLGFVREIPFDSSYRVKASFYYARKAPYGLRLGDAACLGTAEALKLDVLTAEKGWAEIPGLPFKVQLSR